MKAKFIFLIPYSFWSMLCKYLAGCTYQMIEMAEIICLFLKLSSHFKIFLLLMPEINEYGTEFQAIKTYREKPCLGKWNILALEKLKIAKAAADVTKLLALHLRSNVLCSDVSRFSHLWHQVGHSSLHSVHNWYEVKEISCNSASPDFLLADIISWISFISLWPDSKSESQSQKSIKAYLWKDSIKFSKLLNAMYKSINTEIDHRSTQICAQNQCTQNSKCYQFKYEWEYKWV